MEALSAALGSGLDELSNRLGETASRIDAEECDLSATMTMWNVQSRSAMESRVAIVQRQVDDATGVVSVQLDTKCASLKSALDGVRRAVQETGTQPKAK